MSEREQTLEELARDLLRLLNQPDPADFARYDGSEFTSDFQERSVMGRQACVSACCDPGLPQGEAGDTGIATDPVQGGCVYAHTIGGPSSSPQPSPGSSPSGQGNSRQNVPGAFVCGS